MDFMNERGSVQSPPLLDEINYSYWKDRMKPFIKSMDEKVWRAILTGWVYPMKKNESGESVLKYEIE